MTSQELAAKIYPAISTYLGTYQRKPSEGTVKAFWYYGRKAFDSDDSSPHPPSEWRVSGIEVIVGAVPDLDVTNFHGGRILEEFHSIRVIPHGDDISNVQTVISELTEWANGVTVNLIPANEKLKINQQYLIQLRK